MVLARPDNFDPSLILLILGIFLIYGGIKITIIGVKGAVREWKELRNISKERKDE